MKRTLVVTFFLMCVIWRPMNGQQPPGLAAHPLTLQEALDLARARNPVLAVVRSRTEAVRANEITAALRPNPVLNSANEDFNVFNPSKFDPANTQEFTQNVSQLIERGGKRQRRIDSARWSTRIAERGNSDALRQLEFAVKSGFVGLLLAKANLQLAADNLRDYRETVRLSEIRSKAGDISPTDFERIRIEQARFENDHLAADLAVRQARAQLESLLGVTELHENFDIQGELAGPEVELALEDLNTAALASRPDYLAVRDGVSKAEAEVRLADANGASDFTVGGEYKRNGPDNTLGITISLPLRFFDRNQGEKARTRRELEASRSAERAARNAVLTDVRQAYDAYRIARQRAQLYSTEYIKRAREVRQRMEFSYRNGGASLLEYLDAVRSSRDVELAWRSAFAQEMTAVHQLSLVAAKELRP